MRNLERLGGKTNTIEFKAWEAWLGQAAKLADRYESFVAEDPFAYNERASVDLLSTAATMQGLFSVAEYCNSKRSKTAEGGTARGRGDLWISTESRSWSFEFKQFRPWRRHRTRMSAYMKSAQDCAELCMKEEADARFGALIVSTSGIEDRMAAAGIEQAMAVSRDVTYAWRMVATERPLDQTFFLFNRVS